MAVEKRTAETTGAGVVRPRSWRTFVPFAVIVLVTGALAHVVRPPAVEERPPVSFEGVPEHVGEWRHIEDLTLTDTEEKYLVPDAVLYRRYADNSGRPVTVLAVYRRAERREFFHIPEACYPASGLTILDRAPVEVSGGGPSLPAIRITAQGARGRFLTLYWFVSGSRVTESASRQQLAMWIDRLTRNNEGWAFVRVVTPLTSSPADDTKAIGDLCTLISPEIMRAIRESARR